MHCAKHMDALLYALHLPASARHWWWNPYTYTDSYGDANSDTATFSHAHCDIHADADANSDTNSNPNSDTYYNTIAYHNAYVHRYTDALYKSCCCLQFRRRQWHDGERRLWQWE